MRGVEGDGKRTLEANVWRGNSETAHTESEAERKKSDSDIWAPTDSIPIRERADGEAEAPRGKESNKGKRQNNTEMRRGEDISTMLMFEFENCGWIVAGRAAEGERGEKRDEEKGLQRE